MAIPRARVIKAQPGDSRADFENMARWRAFVDVLDELLLDRRESVAEVVARTATRTGRSTSTQPLYGFTANLTGNRFWSTPGPYWQPPASRPTASGSAAPSAPTGPTAHARYAPPPVADEPLRTQQRRLARRLKPGEQRALQTLIRLGAALDVSFTTGELRSAFRTLAQRYHPDRHPGADDAERVRLGAMFAELTAAYGVLSGRQ